MVDSTATSVTREAIATLGATGEAEWGAVGRGHSSFTVVPLVFCH